MGVPENMFSSKNILLVFYTAWVLSTPLPATKAYSKAYSQTVNWTGVLSSSIPVAFSVMYSKSLPKAKKSLLLNLTHFLMLQLHAVGVMTVLFPTAVISLPFLTEIDPSTYCILFTQSELFLSTLLVVTTQSIAIIIVIIEVNPEM